VRKAIMTVHVWNEEFGVRAGWILPPKVWLLLRSNLF